MNCKVMPHKPTGLNSSGKMEGSTTETAGSRVSNDTHMKT